MVTVSRNSFIFLHTERTSHYVVFIIRGFMVWSVSLEINGFLAFAHTLAFRKYQNISVIGFIPLLS